MALCSPTGGSTVRVESLIVLALLIAAMAILSPYFLSVSNFLDILLATPVLGVLAIGATYIICSAFASIGARGSDDGRVVVRSGARGAITSITRSISSTSYSSSSQ